MNMHVQNVRGPAALRVLEDTGLSLVLMRDILLKTCFRRSVETIQEISDAICLPPPLTQSLLDLCRGKGLIEVTGTIHAGCNGDMGYRLTESGKARAIDAISQSEYYGAFPVPLAHYTTQVRQQSMRDVQITRQTLEQAMGHLILPDGLLDQLGPAVGAGRSLLMYGPPGNGKSSIAEGIRSALGDSVFVPHAIEYAGQVITVFDPIVHVRDNPIAYDISMLRKSGPRHDNRYVLCKRPSVITGGELSLSMLDLKYNSVSRTYQAPLQLKSTGGVFIVDDLGRQEESPQSLINRWIVPMEMGFDMLTLQSGEKFEVPFDTLVVFSTNFHPNKLFDNAALRRIFFKVPIPGPTQAQFLKIFAIVAKKKKMPLSEPALVHLLKKRYPEINNAYANFHAPFLIDQLIAICAYEGIPNQMTPELIDRAWENLFVKDYDFAH